MERKSVYVLIRESYVYRNTYGCSDFKVSLTCYADKEKAVAAMKRAFNKKVREWENDGTGFAHMWGNDDCHVSSYGSGEVDTMSYPEDLFLLPGCTVCAKEDYDDQDAWDGCGKVANMCREGSKISYYKADLRHHLEDAFDILEDLMLLMTDKEKICCLSIHALASRARENVVKAAQYVDLRLEPVEPAREV